MIRILFRWFRHGGTVFSCQDLGRKCLRRWRKRRPVWWKTKKLHMRNMLETGKITPLGDPSPFCPPSEGGERDSSSSRRFDGKPWMTVAQAAGREIRAQEWLCVRVGTGSASHPEITVILMCLWDETREKRVGAFWKNAVLPVFYLIHWYDQLIMIAFEIFLSCLTVSDLVNSNSFKDSRG